ncbi:hypothetical protein Bpfe_016129 [Biomphalaria pfeifferi]|uniref:Uncharacterized protein n=1 Tax=Biomphalaria pfeifferi TaxID=112525 RepID=A0AAD8BH19_BIOPF|nr:hypothetical protein Bpfe_016129 [Biomphalaria pfeifferi]
MKDRAVMHHGVKRPVTLPVKDSLFTANNFLHQDKVRLTLLEHRTLHIVIGCRESDIMEHQLKKIFRSRFTNGGEEK